MRHFALSLFGSLCLIAPAALAQSPESSEQVAVRGQDDAAQVAPAPGVRPATLQPGAQAPASGCGPGAVQGFHPGDAQTAVWLVCEEVRRRQGRPITLGPNDAPPFYRVGLLRLGKAVVLSLHAESPQGTIRDSRQLRLANLEEVPVAAPRLVDALWYGTPVSATQSVTNLVGEETREYKKKHGEFLWGGGVLGLYVAGSEAGIQPGLNLRAGYEAERFGVGVDLRFGVGSDGYNQNTADYVALGVGGRHFLSDGDIAPFLGGGVNWSGIDVHSDDWDSGTGFRGDGSGIGLYGEVGLELLRLHTSRLVFDLRFETPLYQIEEDDYGYAAPYDPSAAPDANTSVQEPTPERQYVVPVMAGLSYTF